MKKIKTISLIFVIIGTIAIFIGIGLTTKKDLSNNYFANTTNTFDFGSCVDKICNEEFVIDNKGNNGSDLIITLINKDNKVKKAGKLTIKFDNNIKITISHKQLQPSEEVTIKKHSKVNLGEVQDFELVK